MPEYDLEFGKALIDVGALAEQKGFESHNQMRAVVYISRLSLEIILKAFLEKAGMKISEIRRCSHNLESLKIHLLRNCEIQALKYGKDVWTPPSELCALSVRAGTGTTVGVVLDSERTLDTSKYPVETRYGENLYELWPQDILEAARKTYSFAKGHWGTIRLKVVPS